MFTHWLIIFYAVQLMCQSFNLQGTKISVFEPFPLQNPAKDGDIL